MASTTSAFFRSVRARTDPETIPVWRGEIQCHAAGCYSAHWGMKRQMQHRHRIVKASMPGMLIDTDDWQVPDLTSWRGYLHAKTGLGVLSLYDTTHVGLESEALDETDHRAIRWSWADRRAAFETEREAIP